MPCTYVESASEIAARQNAHDEEVRRKERLKWEALLCSACRALEDFKFDFDKNPELSRWWDKHKQEDAERERKENAARLEKEAVDVLLRKPLAELTKEDKKLLRKNGYSL